ncbi:MAG: hypothetical protein HEP71_19390 [Roseivirga sp.]|nr:hypothetical protein [Roseivirga sp.]
MEGQINEWIFYASSTVFVVLIGVFAFYLYLHKKREGISYPLAIQKLKSFINQKYGTQAGSQERFCDEYGISEKESLVAVLNTSSDEVLSPQVIGEALSKIGPRVVLMNRTYYIEESFKT